GRIEVGSERLEFGAAGIDGFEHRFDAEGAARASDVVLGDSAQVGDSPVGETHRLEFAEVALAERFARDAGFGLDDFGDCVDEPRVDAAQLMRLGARHAEAKRVSEMIEAEAAWPADFLA